MPPLLRAPGVTRELLAVLERSDGTLYFEMRHAESMLRHAAVWDLTYEHGSSLTASALRQA